MALTSHCHKEGVQQPGTGVCFGLSKARIVESRFAAEKVSLCEKLPNRVKAAQMGQRMINLMIEMPHHTVTLPLFIAVNVIQ